MSSAMVIGVSLSGELYRWSEVRDPGCGIRGFGDRGFETCWFRGSADRRTTDTGRPDTGLPDTGLPAYRPTGQLPDLPSADPDGVAAGGEGAGAALQLGQRHFHGLAGLE